MYTFLLGILLPGTALVSSSWQILGTLFCLGKLLRSSLKPWVDICGSGYKTRSGHLWASGEPFSRLEYQMT